MSVTKFLTFQIVGTSRRGEKLNKSILKIIHTVGLLILMLACGVEIVEDFADGFEQIRLHHGAAAYALSQLIIAVSDFAEAKSKLQLE